MKKEYIKPQLEVIRTSIKANLCAGSVIEKTNDYANTKYGMDARDNGSYIQHHSVWDD